MGGIIEVWIGKILGPVQYFYIWAAKANLTIFIAIYK